MDKENKKLDLKTFKFEDFQNKIEEGEDRIGFNTYNKPTFEGEDNVDELGGGKEVDTDLIEPAPNAEPSADTVVGNTAPIDTGDNGVNFATLSPTQKTEKTKEMMTILSDLIKNDLSPDSLTDLYTHIVKIRNENPSTVG